MDSNIEQVFERFIQSIVELEINQPELINFPMAIGINVDDTDIIEGVFAVNSLNSKYDIYHNEEIEYGFTESEIYFPVLNIKVLNRKMIFECCYPNDIKAKDAMKFSIASKMIQGATDIDRIEIEINGKSYQITGFSDDEANWHKFRIAYQYNDNRWFTCFNYIQTFPAIDVSYSDWANDQAYRAWKQDYDEIKKSYQEYDQIFDECDGGGAAGGGDAGGAVGAGGDAGAISTSSDGGDIAGEMAGTSTAEVLGVNEPGKGFFGKDNFYIPARAKCPISRFEIANGGSKRKKNKKGKPQKTPYEKGMKVVVNMFESEDSASIDKKKIISRLRNIASSIKDLDDIKKVEQDFQRNGKFASSKLTSKNPKYQALKSIFIDMGKFIKDICSGKYSASWFTISMVAVALIYVLSPADLIPDVIPVIGQIDDLFVVSLVYNAIKDEFERWKISKTEV